MAIAQRKWEKDHENDQPYMDGGMAAYPTDGVTVSLRPPDPEE